LAIGLSAEGLVPNASLGRLRHYSANLKYISAIHFRFHLLRTLQVIGADTDLRREGPPADMAALSVLAILRYVSTSAAVPMSAKLCGRHDETSTPQISRVAEFHSRELAAIGRLGAGSLASLCREWFDVRLEGGARCFSSARFSPWSLQKGTAMVTASRETFFMLHLGSKGVFLSASSQVTSSLRNPAHVWH